VVQADIIGWLAAHSELLVIYGTMILFGLFAYAYIIPYFVVKRIKHMAESGQAAVWLGNIVPQLLNMTMVVKDEEGKEREMPMVNYLISVGMMNLKMQLKSAKSSIVRSLLTEGPGDDAGGHPFFIAMDRMKESAPKNWKWLPDVISLLGMLKMQMDASKQGPSSSISAASHGSNPWR